MSNPFDVLSQFDRLTSSVFDTARAPRLMPVDLFRDGDQYVLSADLPGRLVHLVAGADPRGAEDRHGRTDIGQGIEAGDELAGDPEHAPGIAMRECGRLFLVLLTPREEQAVLGGSTGPRGPVDRWIRDKRVLVPFCRFLWFGRAGFCRHLVERTPVLTRRHRQDYRWNSTAEGRQSCCPD